MRHPHGLRSAAGAGLPAIGASFGGGFFAGAISHTANGVATHLLIVAPAATGATGTGYTLTTNLRSKTSNTTTSGTTSDFNGAANTAAMVTAGIASHPAAEFCKNLSINGYTDWYLPARYELEIAYYNLKPTTDSNDTGFGTNPYSVPARGSNYTAGTPAQTTVTAFQTGNSEAFTAALPSTTASSHWSSTEDSSNPTFSWRFGFGDGFPGITLKFNNSRVRAFRIVAL